MQKIRLKINSPIPLRFIYFWGYVNLRERFQKSESGPTNWLQSEIDFFQFAFWVCPILSVPSASESEYSNRLQ